MEILFRKISDIGWLKKHFRLPFLFMLLATLVFILDMVVSNSVHGDVWISSMRIKQLLPIGGEWIVLRLIAWGLFLAGVFILSRSENIKVAGCGRWLFPTIMLLVSVVDLYSFQKNQWDIRAKASHNAKLESGRLQFSDTRTLFPAIKHSFFALITHPGDVFESFYVNATQESLCLPLGRVDLSSQGVHNLLSANGVAENFVNIDAWRTQPHAQALVNVLGCDSSKLRIIPQPFFSLNDKELSEFIKNNSRFDLTAVLRGDSPGVLPVQSGTAPLQADYRIKDFNANRLDIELDVKPGQSGWLVYADSYSPHWKAFVNNIETPVYEAYLAFKAVYVKEGRNRIVFEYQNTAQKRAMDILTIMGMFFSVACFYWLIRCCLGKQEQL
jgi:hypothetical protein